MRIFFFKNAYQVSPSGVGGAGDVKKNDGAKSEPNWHQDMHRGSELDFRHNLESPRNL